MKTQEEVIEFLFNSKAFEERVCFYYLSKDQKVVNEIINKAKEIGWTRCSNEYNAKNNPDKLIYTFERNINKQALYALCKILINDEPSILYPEERDALEDFANAECKKIDIYNWTDFYHKNK